MVTVVVIGNGNVASHLVHAFLKVDTINVTQINSRKLTNIPQADVTIIAVSDDAIAKVSSKINNSFVVHTSGSVGLNSLQNKTRKGVFYMLQTFSKDKMVDFSEVPFCLETENKKDYLALETLAKSIGKKVYAINSEQRKTLHVAAVFVNNFTNHLYKIGNEICTEHQVPFEILFPLIKETAVKIETLPPGAAQTGPAIRNDKKTIKNHLDMLNIKQQKIYTILTKSIQNGN
ncbi:Rossmann-like and DUF2520 domain-containing protein [Polaribacter sp.]|uniref:Rossmann-like and DUF2520 domain-containing protein n=1 Tax=Polaribacter sp. TaxID=1920175 RepID=UPI003EF2DF8D